MKTVLALLLFIVLVGAGLRLAGIPLPLLDYPVGPMGIDRGPGMPDIQIEAPGFGDIQAP
jgi:hypothetical protein